MKLPNIKSALKKVRDQFTLERIEVGLEITTSVVALIEAIVAIKKKNKKEDADS